VQVTEVRIKLMEASEDRLRAFCSITLDHCFVVRDLKIIDGTNGPFVAMPSRKLSGHCYRCNYKNHLRASYCNQCGAKLKVTVPADLPQKLYADVAHPVNSECRELISAAVLTEFENELARAAQPGYRSRYDDDFDAISESHDDLFSDPGLSGGVESPRSREVSAEAVRGERSVPAERSGQPERSDQRERTNQHERVEPLQASADQTTSERRIDRVDSQSDDVTDAGMPPSPHLSPREQPSRESSDAVRRRASNSGEFGEGIFDS
jgi:stage V sporulation protein G